MKRVIAILTLLTLIAILALLTLVGRDAPEPSTQELGNGLTEVSVVLSDGRSVICVRYESTYKGGLSCDWEGSDI